MMLKTTADYNMYRESADYIKDIINDEPDTALILGSGLGDFASVLTDKIIIKYSEIPNFPVSTVFAHKGELIYGKIDNKKLIVMNGRFHFYEGYEMWQTAYPIAVFKLLGVKNLILTNAAGGIDDKINCGDFVCITDHIKLTSESPVRGANIDELGERFFDMQSAYDINLRGIAHRTAQKYGVNLKDGVYAYMAGPQFETPAEIKMLKLIGASVVGMSTVAEAIMAAHCGLKTLCISSVTNMAAGITKKAITHDEVIETGKQTAEQFKNLISGIIKEL